MTNTANSKLLANGWVGSYNYDGFTHKYVITIIFDTGHTTNHHTSFIGEYEIFFAVPPSTITIYVHFSNVLERL